MDDILVSDMLKSLLPQMEAMKPKVAEAQKAQAEAEEQKQELSDLVSCRV